MAFSRSRGTASPGCPSSSTSTRTTTAGERRAVKRKPRKPAATESKAARWVNRESKLDMDKRVEVELRRILPSVIAADVD